MKLQKLHSHGNRMSNDYAKLLMIGQLKKTLESFNHQLIDEMIKKNLGYRQEKSLMFSLAEGIDYVTGLWGYFYQHDKHVNESSFQPQDTKIHEANHNQFTQQESVIPETIPTKSIAQLILQAATLRQNYIHGEILNGLLSIEAKQRPKLFDQNHKVDDLKNNQKQNLQESKASNNSQKDFIEFVKRQKIEKEKRKKLIQQQQKKQQQRIKKMKQLERKRQQEQQRERKQQKRKQQQEQTKKRQQQQQKYKRHQSLYSKFQAKLYHSKQQILKQTPLTLLHRYESEQLKNIEKQKQKLYQSYEKSRIDNHEKNYLENVMKRNEERVSRLSQVRQLEEMEKEKSRIRFRSSFRFENPANQYERLKKEEYLKAKEKRDRIMGYKDKVKSTFVPQVDQAKKKQLMSLIQDLDLGRKHYKKKILRNGETVVQKLEIKDAKEVGKNYLQDIKKMVQQARLQKRDNSAEMDLSQVNEQVNEKQSKPKHADYLKQLRQKRASNHQSYSTNFTSPGTIFSKTNKSSPISFEEKLQRIESISSKLLQKTKQEEMLLKYGKFKTSEEILNKKEQIDRNYIDLVEMKLEMIEKGEQGFGW